MSFDWSSLVIFGGIINAFISITVLMIKRRTYGQRISLWLFLFLMVVALILLERIIRFSGLETEYPELLFVTSPLFFFLLPLVYCFQLRLVGSSKYWYLHFILPIGILLLLFPTITMPNTDKLTMYHQEGINDPPILILGYLMFVAYYSVKTFILNKRHKHQLYNVYATNEVELQLFANKQVFLSTIFSTVIPISLAIQYLDFDTRNLDKTLYILFSFIPHLILISILALRDTGYMVESKINTTSRNEIENDQLEVLKSELALFMKENRPYLDSGLQLQVLADKIGWNRSQLSMVINTGFGKNFYDFVNEQRLQAVLQKVGQGLHEEYSLDYIVGVCGFRSYVSFYRSFKRLHNTSPNEYLKRMKKRNEITGDTL